MSELWQNENLQQLQTNSTEKLLYIQLYLRYGGTYEDLKTNLGIKITYHPTLPLVIFNYDIINTPRKSLIGLECRGLVLENNENTWNVVAKPFYRFFNYDEIAIKDALHANFNVKMFDFESCETQIKEDGSLMILYNYRNTWMLNTRTNFVHIDGDNGDNRLLMSGLYEVKTTDIAKIFLNGFDLKFESLNDLGNLLCKDETYCFEFCSAINRVVRTYNKDTVFLLAVSNNYTFNELSTNEVNVIAKSISINRPEIIPITNIHEIVVKLKEVSQIDPTLEGFVIRDKNASRWKIKSYTYFVMHNVIYDKILVTPKTVVPLILNGEISELFSVIKMYGYLLELEQLKEMHKYCKEILDAAWIELVNDYNGFKVDNNNHNLLSPAKSLIYQNKNGNLDTLSELWKNNTDLLIKKYFSNDDTFKINLKNLKLDFEPIENYTNNIVVKEQLNNEWWLGISGISDDINNGLAKQAPIYDKQWVVYCHCGELMKLFSVPKQWNYYKCHRENCQHCNKKEELLSNIENNQKNNQNNNQKNNQKNNNVIIYQCKCKLIHQTHQTKTRFENNILARPFKGKPLGIPCSQSCLLLRHLMHEELDKYIAKKNIDVNEGYKQIGRILDRDKHLSHIASLGINECQKVIKYFKELN